MPEPSVAPSVPDQRSLLAEIERDVRERRRDGSIDPAFEADKLSLIRTHLGWLTLLRYRLHLRKKRWLAARHTTP